MNTEKSESLLARSRDQSFQTARKTVRFSRTVSGVTEDVFPLLCPTREADWIPGWDAELIYTESGYAERDCVFRTDPAGMVGPGIWVFTRHEEPIRVEIARFTPDVLIQLRVSLENSGSRETTVHWEVTVTGLNQAGTAQVERLAGEYGGRLEGLTAALDHYLRTGETIPEQPVITRR